jgi:hypothetical protein
MMCHLSKQATQHPYTIVLKEPYDKPSGTNRLHRTTSLYYDNHCAIDLTMDMSDYSEEQ